eukprot:6200939-Pleurochrysis_carterae.AAC.3
MQSKARVRTNATEPDVAADDDCGAAVGADFFECASVRSSAAQICRASSPTIRLHLRARTRHERGAWNA